LRGRKGRGDGKVEGEKVYGKGKLRERKLKKISE